MNVQQVIERLESQSKQGESYDEKGRHGWRNPIRADTGLILKAFTQVKNPKCVLEIGTAYGLSGCYIASALTHALMVSIEWDDKVAQEAQKNFELAGLQVKVVCGDALKAIQQFKKDQHRQFDMVFFDANKDGYFEQLEALLNGYLLERDCLILADNVIDRKAECQEFLDFFVANQVAHTILPTECGLFVARI